MTIKPLRSRLDRERKRNQLTFETIQQDYLLSWVLSGLFEHPLLRNGLIFKGGTALNKCYFGEYRFSEDLDFSVISSIPKKEELLTAIIEACRTSEQKMKEFTDIRLFVERYEEKEPHPFDQEAFKVRAQFPWHRSPQVSIMIEITTQETLLFPSAEKQIIHPYGEKINTPINTYLLEEIILEKLRAILQKTKKLHEEGRDRSRIRDYYDLWRILNVFKSDLFFENFSYLLQQKCLLKNVNFSGVESFFDPVMMETVSRTWEKWLGTLVADLPAYTTVISELKSKIELLLAHDINELPSIIIAMNQKRLVGDSLHSILKRAIEKGCNVNEKTSNGHHFLQLLIKASLNHRQKLDLVKLAVEQGADIESSDTSTLTPFAAAVSIGDKAIADFLRAKGASPKVSSSLYSQYYKLYLKFPV